MRSEQSNGVYAGDLIAIANAETERPRSFEYVPQPDITAYELALLLEIVMTSVARGDLDAAYDRLPPEAKRHLRIV